MTQKIIYISFTRLTEKMARDWFIYDYKQRGISVEYWDVSFLLRGEYLEENAIEADYLYSPKSFAAVYARVLLPENIKASYMMLVTVEWRFIKIYELLSKLGVRMYYVAWGAMPSVISVGPRSLTQRLLRSNDLMASIANKILIAAYKKIGWIRPFEVVFAAGYAMANYGWYAKRVVSIHSLDYERCRQSLLSEEKIVMGRYAVFLDINLPYQSDLALHGMDPIDSSLYFDSLNRFFSLIEKKYDLRVVIAAHPKSSYSSSEFNGRMITRGNTANLVKNSYFVISHHSTSVGYAVFNFKPIIFFYTNEIKNMYSNSMMKYLVVLSDALGASLFNVDLITGDSDLSFKPVNHVLYKSFVDNYLSNDATSLKTTADIILENIESEH